MKDFSGKLAVVTGGGTGMGRELVRQLVAEGCDVAFCDVIEETMAETKKICDGEVPQGVKTSTHICDVSDEDAVNAMRDAIKHEHDTDHIHLLFNNAGVGGGGSFINDTRADWERTFNICWSGVYYCARAFMPMLMKAEEAHLINTSSVNGFWASLGPQTAHTAYSAAKFAVKGFSEALVNDLRMNAPHVKVSVVMPGHIGTQIAANSGRIVSGKTIDDYGPEEMTRIRENIRRQGQDPDGFSDEMIKKFVKTRQREFAEGGMSARDAAKVILDGVKQERWRILVGEDAKVLDAAVREMPEEAYEANFLQEIGKRAGGAWEDMAEQSS